MFCLMCFVLLLMVFGFVIAHYEDPFMLDEHCNGTVYIPCPSLTQGRAGSVQFFRLPINNCRVVLSLQEHCQFRPGMKFSMYINIRNFGISGPYRISGVRFSDPARPNKALKEYLYGTEKTYAEQNNTQSIDQLLIQASEQPRVLITVSSRLSGAPFASKGTILDYVTLYSDVSPVGTTWQYCAALSGFMPGEFVCDTRNDRLNCPGNYEYNATFPNPGRPPSYCSGYPVCIGLPQGKRRFDITLGQGPVAGLVIGPIVITFVILAVFWVRRLLNRRGGYHIAPTAEALYIPHTPVEMPDFISSGKDDSVFLLDLPPSYSSLDLTISSDQSRTGAEEATPAGRKTEFISSVSRDT